MGSEDEAGRSPREGGASLSESGPASGPARPGGHRLPEMLRGLGGGLLSAAKETQDTPTKISTAKPPQS